MSDAGPGQAANERARWGTNEKLRALSPLLWINLDASTARRESMEAKLRARGLGGRRIAAVDGRNPEAVARFLQGSPPAHPHNAAEIGCTLSHLRAIDACHRDPVHDFAVICEDDVNFDLAEYWPFRFRDLLAALPADWECLQMAISTSADDLRGWLHRREPTEYCACAYVIRRSYAERLMGLLACGDRYDLSRLQPSHRFGHCIDHFLYELGITYSIPILTYDHELSSTIQVEPVLTRVARQASSAIRAWWKTDALQMTAAELLSVDA